MRRLRFSRWYVWLAILTGMLAWAAPVLASEGEGESGHGAFTQIFLWIAIILLVAKTSGLVERFGQPAVLGELVMGVILGNLVLLGINYFEAFETETILVFLAELGVVILLFQVGLESKLNELGRVGIQAGLVAIVGVVVPFALGTYVVGPLLLPGLDNNAYLFLGAALTATSVGITARVFRDLGRLQSSEAKIVLGAAVIDDVMGLIILAIVSAIVTAGSVSFYEVAWITTKAILFLVVAIVAGVLLTPYINQAFSKINAGIGMKFTLLIVFALVFAYAAAIIGLAPIVGAFAAGLVLEPVHYRNFKDPEIIDHLRHSFAEAPAEVKGRINHVIEQHSDRHVEELIEPIANFFVPIFFVMTGMAVRIDVLFDPAILLVALGITVVAVIGKVVAGLIVTGGPSKILIGFSMVPRGEVGLIFASIGRGLGVISDEVFSVIVIMVILTTLMTPPILAYLINRQNATPTGRSEAASVSASSP